MARPLRIQGPGLTYHVMTRGNRKGAIVVDDEDRHKFLECFEACIKTHSLVCHAYCLMDNHYHAVITTSEANLSRAMHQLHSGYATWWNRRHRAVGHLFQGRFTARLVQEDRYLLVVCRYVVLNPVRARLVQQPEQWRWSSYRATAGLVALPEFLWPHLLLGQFGAPNGTAVERYRQFVEDGLKPDAEVPARRAAILGDPEFVARFADILRSAPREIPLQHRRQIRPALDELFRGTARRSDRNHRIFRAYRCEHYSIADIARFLDLHPTTVGKIVSGKGSSPEKGGNSGSDP